LSVGVFTLVIWCRFQGLSPTFKLSLHSSTHTHTHTHNKGGELLTLGCSSPRVFALESFSESSFSRA